jgi:hypothetical protein
MQGNGNPATIGTNGNNTIPGQSQGDHRISIGQAPGQAGNEYATNSYTTEILFYNRILDSTEIEQVQTYLATKYGITLGA